MGPIERLQLRMILAGRALGIEDEVHRTIVAGIDQNRDLDCGVLVHGIGMCNEYPQVPSMHRFERTGCDGHFETDMTVSVESYIGEPGGTQGVKLEEMVRITDKGTERIARFPFEEELLGT